MTTPRSVDVSVSKQLARETDGSWVMVNDECHECHRRFIGPNLSCGHHVCGGGCVHECGVPVRSTP